MLPGKIAQFRAIPYEARKRIELPQNILELIELTNAELEELAAADEGVDEYQGKDMQFHRVRLNPDWEDADPAELSDEYEEEFIPDENLEPEPGYGPENLRRSRRSKLTKKTLS